MHLRQDTVAAALTALALGFVAPASAQTSDAPFGLGQFLKATGGGAPAAAAPAETTEPAEAPAPRVHKRRVAHRAYTRHAHHTAPVEESKSVAKAEPPAAPAAPAATTVAATTTAAASAHPTPSPAPPLGPSPFLDARSASWPPMGVTAEALPGDVKIVHPGEVNELDLAADEASRRLDTETASMPAPTTDGRSMEASSAEPEATAVQGTQADDDNAWWGFLLMTAGGGLGLGYFVWPLLARLRRSKVPA
jgi:hypothetical protein